jgi:uncharacterized protein YjdB
VSWVSSNENVVRISNTGILTAVDVGTATITVTTANGRNGRFEITVDAIAVSSVEFPEPMDELDIEVEEIRVVLRNRTIRDRQFNVGDTVDFSVLVFPENATNKNYIIEYSDLSIINITENNSFEFVNQGELTITATAENGEFGYFRIISILPVESIEIEAESTYMNVTESMTLAYKIKPVDATIQTVEWVSLNEDIVHVDSSGAVTAIRAGTAAIKAVAHNGKEAEIKLTIILPVSSIVLNVNENNFHTGENQFVMLEIYPENATFQKITWASLNPDIVRIDSSGNITALNSGEATIRATAHNGVYKDITIIIYPIYLRWLRDYGYYSVIIIVISVCAILTLRRLKINRKLESRMIKNKPIQHLLK